MDLTTSTPTEIDTKWAALDGEYFALLARLTGAMDNLHRVARDRKVFHGTRSVWAKSNDEVLAEVQTLAETDDHAKRTLDAANTIHAALAANSEEVAKLQAEYDSRGGWNRAFLAITNGKGHVHSSQNCPTCNNGINRTQFDWMIDWSNATEEQIIADAGHRACTRCYPDAPVDKATSTKMFSADEITAAAARAERDAAKVKRDADKLAKALLSDGSTLRVSVNGYDERFKTEAATSQWLIRHMGEHKVYGYRYDADAVAVLLEALAAKHGVGVEVEGPQVAAKLAAWVKREEREAAKVRARLGV